MSRKSLLKKQANRTRRQSRIRAVVKGDAKRPRLSTHFSNRHVTAQLIDDDKQASVVYISTVGQKNTGESLTDKAAWVGGQVAAKAQTAKISRVVFDRGGKLYHGRVAALAEAARKGGLKF